MLPAKGQSPLAGCNAQLPLGDTARFDLLANAILVTENNPTLDDMLELPHVARPGVSPEQVGRGLRDLGDRPVKLAGEAFEEVLNARSDLFATMVS